MKTLDNIEPKFTIIKDIDKKKDLFIYILQRLKFKKDI